jgi:2-amino-4-hydroxy-6-hydroxymethyldihydropteridine diphosphokinase
MSTPVRVAFGLGSNLGDRLKFLSDAIASLGEVPGIAVVAVSPLVETDPVGGPDQRDYLNAVVVGDTTLTPEAILEVARHCEQMAGRTREQHWGPRTLDIDVLAYDDLSRDDATLTLPHPRATERAFVMVPWAAVDPTFRVLGRSVEEWSDELGTSGVRPFDGRL